MAGDDTTRDRAIRRRIVEQFSYAGATADVWRAFDRFLDTDAYLNLGYSPRYVPHVLGSSGRRLARVVGGGLAERMAEPAGTRLLDVGCGRGGPAAELAGRFGFDVTGVDLVPYNVAAARRTAARADVPAEFVVGDATRLPVATDAVDVATAIDALVYVPEEAAAFEELARVVRPGGVVAVSDLLASDGLDAAARSTVDAFADAWDMPPIAPAVDYVETLESAGFVAEAVRDLSPHSVGRFRKWTRLYLGLAGRRGRPLERLLAGWGLDADRITGQVRAAHGALPHLQHVLVFARREESPPGPQRSRPSSA